MATAWNDARLGADLGRYSFRRWRAMWTPATRGVHRLMVRAVSNAGEQMPDNAALEPRRVHAQRRRGDQRDGRLSRRATSASRGESQHGPLP